MRTLTCLVALLALAGGVADAQEDQGRRLQGMSIIGNEELPKSLYIIPWKESGYVDIAGRPPRGLIDEALSPVDPEVFRRELRYRRAMEP
ncbi:hypothetical protein H0Z60_05140 [Ectothiorhodospiraceae bacterium WFHF3C12]|nr:hypothetical protein [Ectothiorhodospiraceae bacterium WFHF3C12]